MNGPSSRVLSRLNLGPPSRHLTASRCIALLQSFTRSRSIKPGKQLHALILSSGLLPAPLLAAKLAAFYALCGHTAHARHLFDEIPTKTPFLWNTLIRSCVQTRLYSDALHLFAERTASGYRPDNFTYPFVLKACGDLSLLESGRKIHCMALVGGFGLDEYVQNSLIAMYMSCGVTGDAKMVFDWMPNRSVVSWNTLIAGCFKNGCAWEALAVFDRMMMDAAVKADEATIVSVLPACASLGDLQRGRWLHELVKERGFGEHVAVTNALIDMYAKCGSLEAALSVFNDTACERDVVSWTAMIGGYALHGSPSEVLELSHQMQLSGIRPNSVTIVALLSTCSSLPLMKHGKCVHASCIRRMIEQEIIVETALIDMYAKCGDMDLGSRVFSMGSRRTATWNAVISGFARNGLANVAIGHFKWMLAEAIRPDLATIASIFPAYGNSADLKQAKNIHSFLIRMGFLRSIEAATGLVDVYAKVGCLDVALELFQGLTVKDIVSWSAIIAGYGKHGHAKTAIWLFDRMVESGVEPNEVTFTSILYSCSHAGLVDDGLDIFNRMLHSQYVSPSVDHYACIIDLLGRAGRLEEAYKLIRTMTFEPNHAVWGALLGACVIHENVELGEVAAKQLFEIEPENTGNYVLLGNIYAAVGRWEDAETVREMVKERGLSKAPGCSSIEVMSMRS